MATVYLVRHGQASFDSDDYDKLSDLGFQQARHLGLHLTRRLQPDMIFSGTMRRHQETAHSVLEAFEHIDSQGLQLMSEWNEFDHQNVIAALNPDWADSSVFRQHIYQHQNPEHYFLELFAKGIARWVSGEYDEQYNEPWQAFKERTLRAIDKVIEALPDKGRAIVFTSGGPISCVTQNLLSIPDHFLLNMNKSLVNCGVTKIAVTSLGRQVSSLNDHSSFDSEEHRHLITYK
ncbi:histidine phosphatase family protein [Aliikangiella marina]|uniref:Histidine phosphatase family protein n=1 Tax=Aliikangiella marina TaxID=1712262 RepID=A0A545TH85_9GAMM|nr:histidine phosphatase family protein [Aliikangiella marina]TQV76594.1 histidine phosphatase family protein [Aliikangiella marina]